MGLLKPPVRPGTTQPLDEVQRLEVRARLPKSQSANFIRGVGIVLVVISVLALVAGGTFGFIPAIAGAVSGGFIWAAGALQQTVYDIRTLMLRAADRRETDMLAASADYETDDAHS